MYNSLMEPGSSSSVAQAQAQALPLSPHFYTVFLNEGDPLIEQPLQISKGLKPHQRTAVYKCIEMETKPQINYFIPPTANVIMNNPTFKNYFQMNTNVGVIGDIVGYGKTLIALSLIQTSPIQNIYNNQYQTYSYGTSRWSGNMTFYQEIQYEIPIDSYIHTTLVVVPRGPVYMQWKKSIEKDTNLKYLYIDSLHTIRKLLPEKMDALRAYLETFDLILIKNTTLKIWFSYLKELTEPITLYGFDRIMIDEAHEIADKIHRMNFRFIWLITSSYIELATHSYTKSIFNSISLVLNRERLHYMLVKSREEYIKKSFEIPQPIENYYLCKMDKQLSVLTGFVSNMVLDRINVNDIAGAIQEIGGAQETETSLIETVRKEFLKNIQNKQKELAFIESLELENEQREGRLKNVNTELVRLNDRYEALQERLLDLATKTCPICMDVLDNPVYLNCTHTICGKCLFEWARLGVHTRNKAIHCPECRTPIESNKIVAIIKHSEAEEDADAGTDAGGSEAGTSASGAAAGRGVVQLLSKEDKFIQILKSKPDGRFLMFSRLDSQFYRLCILLREQGIVYSEMKGSTTHMMNVLNDFNQGTINIILLNTNYSGFGIDISTATDVIIYHHMPNEKIQAVGRAQRVGRKDVLTIHNLCYSHELQNTAA